MVNSELSVARTCSIGPRLFRSKQGNSLTPECVNLHCVDDAGQIKNLFIAAYSRPEKVRNGIDLHCSARAPGSRNLEYQFVTPTPPKDKVDQSSKASNNDEALVLIRFAYLQVQRLNGRKQICKSRVSVHPE